MHGSIDTSALLAIVLTWVLIVMVVCIAQIIVWAWHDHRGDDLTFAPRDPENLDPYGPQNHEVK